MIFAVTGGVAMGKSEVNKKILELIPNSEVFDADAVVSELLTRDNICRKIQKVFGDESIDESGLINRKFIREQVFDSVNQRAKLESILHPEVRTEYDKFICDSQYVLNDRILFAEIPLLYESKSDYKCDYTIVVATDRNTQYERLIERSTIDSSMASKIIDSQMNINEKIKLCDFMIWNSGNHKQLNKQIEFFISWLKTKI